ncbi:Spc110p KNAG_0C05060 [Huiozyma naganishii CBS 8797]|uniref:Spindle pole body component 110 n=1 Tax=Huiozyma naganishii (strain ATCC MYA-139 / BCRC 22969 / CBS 8797 / KCTC 17520 / NBRC 10181 / NCYC 3082 / Yp74L-3) TaxID=1071383 RepID=J7RX36_HUIN7|nr:hypothetical protein KNAG_0C05060 [Kazachstania naganishii CBS 8797]CCK69607.1 hypothetical protein KNAG_0C05060 [Kazachstania naganishii CBS 8797]
MSPGGGAIASKHFEFTPIGYVKEKQSDAAGDANHNPALSPTRNNDINEKRGRGGNGADFSDSEDVAPRRKHQRRASGDDDTINSMKLFNDASQFDDTLPEIQVNMKSTTTKMNAPGKNLLTELNENTAVSNPIRQQQQQMQTYARAISILKLKNNTLIQLLKDEDPTGKNIDKNLKLIDQLTKEKDKNNLLLRDNTQLQTELDKLTEQVNNKDDTTTNENEEESHAQCQEEKDRLLAKLEDDQTELTKLQDKLTALENSTESSSELNRLNNTIVDLQANEKKYQIQISQLDIKLKDSTRLLETKEGSYQREVTSLSEKVKETTLKLTQQREEFEKVNNDLKQKLSALREDLRKKEDQHERELRKLKDTIKSSSNDNTEFIESLKKDVETKRTRLAQLETDLQKSKRRVTELESTLNTINTQYSDIQKEFKEYQIDTDRRLNNIDNSDKRHLVEHSKEIERVKADHLLEMTQLEKNYDSLLTELNSSKAELSEKLEGAESELAKCKEELNSKKIEHERLINSHETNVKSLKDQIYDQTTQIRSLESTVDDLSADIGRKEAALLLLQTKYDELSDRYQSNNEISQDVEKITRSLENQINDLNHKLNHANILLSTKDAELSSTSNELSSATTSIKKLTAQIHDKTEKIEQSRAKISQLESQLFNKTIKASKESLKTIETKNAQIDDLTEQLEKAKSEFDRALKTNNILEEQISRKYQDQIKDLEDEVDGLSNTLRIRTREENERIKQLNEDIQEWQDRYDTLNDTLQSQISKRSHSTRAEQLSFKRERESLLQEVAEKDGEIDKLKQKNTSILEENDNLRDYLKSSSKLSSGFEQLMTKYKDMKRTFAERVASLEKENLELEESLHRTRIDALSRDSSGPSPNVDRTHADLADYYRIKYHNEVTHNNDMKVMNDYLNLVLRATTQKLRTDLRRVKRELSTSGALFSGQYNGDNMNSSYDDYIPPTSRAQYGPVSYDNYYNNDYLYSRRSPRLKFKTVALMVKACIRMKSVALKHDMTRQNLRYLERKIRAATSTKPSRGNTYL